MPTPWRGNGRVLFEASSLHHFRSSNVCNIFIKYISLMFKHLTLKRVAVLVLLGTIKLIIYNDMFPGVRKGIINLFNFKSINFNLVDYLPEDIIILFAVSVFGLCLRGKGVYLEAGNYHCG
jgi:hypothetical protein